MAASEALEGIVLTLADVAGALVLSTAAGWNQTADDWAFFIAHGHAIGFRTASGRLVATATALAYGGGLGWVSMVLVAGPWRHRGLASLLLEGVVKKLQGLHVTPVLDATPEGEPVYRHLGFRAGFAFERWEGIALADGTEPAGAADVRGAGIADLDAIAALDQAANGAGRRQLLQNLLVRAGTHAWMTRAGSGFVLARDGKRATQVGPLVASDPAAAIQLLDSALRAQHGPVFLDVPSRWGELGAWLGRRGFVRQRPFMRMSLAPAPPLACGDRAFVVAGPEFG